MIQLDTIENEIISKLEKKLRLKFQTPEMIFLALCTPSMKNLYQEVQAYLSSQNISSLSETEYDELKATSEAAKVLVLVGDRALDLAVVQDLWDVNLATVGQLTQKKSEMVSNAKLAETCDEWNLHQSRLVREDESVKKKSSETIIHDKGTLIEAILGVIYLEFGMKELTRILPYVKYS